MWQCMQEKKALSSRGRGRLRGFLELRRPWGFPPEARRGSQGASRAAPVATKPVESQEARPKSTVCLTSQRHPEKLPKVTAPEVTRAQPPAFPRNLNGRWTSLGQHKRKPDASEKSGILWIWDGPLGTPLVLRQWKRRMTLSRPEYQVRAATGKEGVFL